MVAASIAEASGRPVIGPPLTKAPDSPVPVWLDTNWLLVQSVIGMATFIAVLIKIIWNGEKKRMDRIEKACSHIPALVEGLKRLTDHVEDNLPTHKEVELMVLRELLKNKDKKDKPI